MRRRLLRHTLAGGINPEDAFVVLAADGDDVFWLDSGQHGVHVLGSGERIFDGVEFGFEPVETLHSPLATHIRYRRTG